MEKKDSFETLLSFIYGTERTVEACAHGAYRDIQRNLTGINSNKMPVEKKVKWRDDIEKLIRKRVDILSTDPEAFDTWHKETCDAICAESKRHNISTWVEWLKPMENGFTYGLAQKWLNMTIKNMLLMAQEEWAWLDQIKSYLHVPVDKYVLDEAYKQLDVRAKFEDKFTSLAWSRWNDYDDLYFGFQERIRKVVNQREDYDSPMGWEFVAWVNARGN